LAEGQDESSRLTVWCRANVFLHSEICRASDQLHPQLASKTACAARVCREWRTHCGDRGAGPAACGWSYDDPIRPFVYQRPLASRPEPSSA